MMSILLSVCDLVIKYLVPSLLETLHKLPAENQYELFCFILGIITALGTIVRAIVVWEKHSTKALETKKKAAEEERDKALDEKQKAEDQLKSANTEISNTISERQRIKRQRECRSWKERR